MSSLRPRFANPIYDAAFKHLMADTEIARQVIGRLLGCRIDKIELRPQEITTLRVELPTEELERLFHLLRLDFAAQIEESRDSAKPRTRTVLIEVQKGRLQDVRRFRIYLGQRYMTKGEDRNLPIVCIYLLGYITDARLPQVTRVERRLVNALTGEPICLPAAKPEAKLVEQLTHDAVFVQLEKHEPSEGVVARDLERLLAVFDQKRKRDGNDLVLELDDALAAIAESDKLIHDMLRILQAAACDEQTMRDMQAEDELQDAIDEIIEDRDQVSEALEQERAEKERERAAKEEERLAKEAALAARDEAESRIQALLTQLRQLGVEPQ